MAALLTQLSAQAAILDGAQFNGAAGDGTTLKAWVTAAKSDITAAVGAYNNAVAACDTFISVASNANYDAMKTAASNYAGAVATSNLLSKISEQDSAPCAADNFIAPSVSVATAAAAATAALPAFVSAAQAGISSMPALGPYALAVAAVALPPATVRVHGTQFDASRYSAVHTLDP